MDERKSTCRNCKYFRRYYILNSTLRYVATDKGFCGKCGVRENVAKKHLKEEDCCYLWQPYELQKLCEKYTVEIVLEKIYEMLSYIRDILDNDIST